MEIIPREEWGAKAPGGPNPNRTIALPAPEIWIHHTVTPVTPEKEVLRNFQQTHINRAKSEGWSVWDIAYNFIIFPTGNIYEGRGWGKYGVHTQDHNHLGHGIAFAGNYNDRSPTVESLDAARWLIAHGRSKGYVWATGSLPTGGHRDVWATACPGSKLYAKLDYLRQEYDMAFTSEQERFLKAVVAAIKDLGVGTDETAREVVRRVLKVAGSHPRDVNDKATHATTAAGPHTHAVTGTAK